MDSEPKRTFKELDIVNNVDLETNHYHPDAPNNMVAQTEAPFLKNRLDFLAKKIVFRYRPETNVVIDGKRLIVFSLLMLMLEYCILFAFQLISYFTLDRFWHRSRFIPGVILGPIYGVLCILLVFFSNIRQKALVYCLKVLEFLTAFFLLGYLAPLDFGTISLTYVMIFNIILMYLFVSLKDVLQTGNKSVGPASHLYRTGGGHGGRCAVEESLVGGHDRGCGASAADTGAQLPVPLLI